LGGGTRKKIDPKYKLTSALKTGGEVRERGPLCCPSRKKKKE